MDKWQALQSFWSGFGLTAYDQATVPLNAQLPYITYEAAISSASNDVYTVAAVWYYGYSWAEVSQKVDEIAEAIGARGVRIDCDEGQLWIRQANPFARRAVTDPADDQIRRINLMVNIKFETHI